MFRLSAKLAVATFAFVVAGLFLTGGTKAAAYCPSSFQDAQNNHNWGVNTGGHTGDMAGLIIHSYDAKTNKNIQVTYHLRSGISAQDPKWGKTPNGTTVNLNDRLFHNFNGLPPGFENDPTNRTNNYASATTPNFFGGCNGWDAFGPANPLSNNYTGNGEVLDCGPTDQPSHFWFTNMRPTPVGDGQNGENGYWSIRIFNPHLGRTFKVDHYTEGSMSFSNNYFTVSNGYNTFVELIWHPQPPPPTPGDGDGTGSCQNVKVDEHAGTGEKTRVWVTASGVSVGKQKYTNNAGDVAWDPGPNSTFNPRHQDIASWVGPGGAGGDEGINVSKEWWYQPNANSITVTYRVDRFQKTWDSDKKEWNYKNSSWSNGTTQYLQANGSWSSSPSSIDCFKADACITNPLNVSGDGPNDKVIEGGAMHVSGTYKNTGVLPLWYPSVLASDGNYYPVDIGGSATLGPGGTAPFSFTLTAPNGIGYADISVTPTYFGAFSSGSCSAHVPVYVHFQLTPHATLDYSGTKEYPKQINYSTYVTNDAPRTIPAPSSSKFTYTPYSGGTGCPNTGPVGTPGGQFAPGGPDYTIAPTSCKPSSYEAGDLYCSRMDLTSYNSGYVGPGGDVVGATTNGSTSDEQCLRIVNEPYFKTYGTGMTIGGDFSTNGDGKCSGGGLLAGYTNNADSPSRGAGTQLSALALIKITGVASAQKSYPTSSPPGTALTFANTNASDISSSLDSPGLGGNFDPGGSRCITDQKPKTGATVHDGNYTQGAKTGISDDQSVFVNGDVRITGNITYSDGWSIDDVPSFVLRATGNIYIDPGVTRLDGTYISNKTVYTCSNNSFTPKPASSMYTGCKNQLVFNGSVAANKINLMRTFGSLRDERPSGGSPAGSQLGLYWTTAGPPSGSLPSGYNCTYVDEPSDPHTWNDNYLCAPTGAPISFAWTHYDNNPSPGGPAGWYTTDYLKTHGYPYCTKWDIPADYGHTWYDNSLCMSKGRADGTAWVQFRTSNDPSEYCTPIGEYADPDGKWNTYGYYLCEPKAAPAVPASVPAAPPCSNKGTQLITGTCAAEIFNFSPELYLSTPDIRLPNNGAVQYDAVTSLPPVL